MALDVGELEKRPERTLRIGDDALRITVPGPEEILRVGPLKILERVDSDRRKRTNVASDRPRAFSRAPIASALFVLAAVMITGSPPFGFFFSEMTILKGGFASSHIRWTQEAAMDANWRSLPRRTPSSIWSASAFTWLRVRDTPTCCSSLGPLRATWRPRSAARMKQRRTRASSLPLAPADAAAGFSAKAPMLRSVALTGSCRWTCTFPAVHLAPSRRFSTGCWWRWAFARRA